MTKNQHYENNILKRICQLYRLLHHIHIHQTSVLEIKLPSRDATLKSGWIQEWNLVELHVDFENHFSWIQPCIEIRSASQWREREHTSQDFLLISRSFWRKWKVRIYFILNLLTSMYSSGFNVCKMYSYWHRPTVTLLYFLLSCIFVPKNDENSACVLNMRVE